MNNYCRVIIEETLVPLSERGWFGYPYYILNPCHIIFHYCFECIVPFNNVFRLTVVAEQGQNTSKKKTTFSRLLRGLKTHRKEKQSQQAQGSPRHGRARMGVPQRVSVHLT